jgi:hypothetical protein
MQRAADTEPGQSVTATTYSARREPAGGHLGARCPAHRSGGAGVRRPPARRADRPAALPQGARPPGHRAGRLGQRGDPQPRAGLLRPPGPVPPDRADPVAVVEPGGVRVLGPRGLAPPGRAPPAVPLAHGRGASLGRRPPGRGRQPRPGGRAAGRGAGPRSPVGRRDGDRGSVPVGRRGRGELVGRGRRQAGDGPPVPGRRRDRHPAPQLRARLPAARPVAAAEVLGTPDPTRTRPTGPCCGSPPGRWGWARPATWPTTTASASRR